MMTQWNVANGKLSCILYQRSADFMLGVPWNIAFYALFTMVMAQMASLELGEFIWVGGDVHIYLNHIEQAKLQLTRTPKPLPTMRLRDRGQGLDDWEYEDFQLEGYDPHPRIKAEVSV